jgi:hypothetical protein
MKQHHPKSANAYFEMPPRRVGKSYAETSDFLQGGW